MHGFSGHRFVIKILFEATGLWIHSSKSTICRGGVRVFYFSSTYTHQLSYLGPFMCRRCQGEARIFQCHIFKGGLEFSVSAGEWYGKWASAFQVPPFYGGARTFQCKPENEMANGFHLCSFHLFKGGLGLFSASRRARNDMTNAMHLCFNDEVHHDR